MVILHGLTILPDMVIHFDLNKEKSLLAVEHAMLDDQKILIVTKINPQEDDPDLDQLYPVGTIAKIKQMTRLPGQVVRVLVEGVARAEVNSIDKSLPYITASSTFWE